MERSARERYFSRLCQGLDKGYKREQAVFREDFEQFPIAFEKKPELLSMGYQAFHNLLPVSLFIAHCLFSLNQKLCKHKILLLNSSCSVHTGCIYIYTNVHSPTDGHLCCFHFLAITNKAAMNILVQVIVWTYAFISLR